MKVSVEPFLVLNPEQREAMFAAPEFEYHNSYIDYVRTAKIVLAAIDIPGIHSALGDTDLKGAPPGEVFEQPPGNLVPYNNRRWVKLFDVVRTRADQHFNTAIIKYSNYLDPSTLVAIEALRTDYLYTSLGGDGVETPIDELGRRELPSPLSRYLNRTGDPGFATRFDAFIAKVRMLLDQAEK
jgi:hypothetical protein